MEIMNLVICIRISLNVSGIADSQNSSNISQETITCREGFYPAVVAGVSGCKPLCGWELYPHSTELTIRILIIIITVLGIAAGIVVLVISCINRKRM